MNLYKIVYTLANLQGVDYQVANTPILATKKSNMIVYCQRGYNPCDSINNPPIRIDSIVAVPCNNICHTLNLLAKQS